MNDVMPVSRLRRSAVSVWIVAGPIVLTGLLAGCSGNDTGSSAASSTTQQGKAVSTTKSKPKAGDSTSTTTKKGSGGAAKDGALIAENDDEKLLLSVVERSASDPCAAVEMDSAAVTAAAAKGTVRPAVVSEFFSALATAVDKLDLPDVATEKALLVSAYQGIAKGVVGAAPMPDLGTAFQTANAKLLASAKKGCGS